MKALPVLFVCFKEAHSYRHPRAATSDNTTRPVGTLCEGGSRAPDALSHRRKGKPRPGAGRLRCNAISVTRAPYAVCPYLNASRPCSLSSYRVSSDFTAGRGAARAPRPCSLDPVRVHVLPRTVARQESTVQSYSDRP